MDAGIDPSGRDALILGAGGAGRACALALARSGVASITVAAREPARVADVSAAVDGLGADVRAVAFDEAADRPGRPDRERHAARRTPETLPVPALGPGSLVVDLLYHPSVTPLLVQARAEGAVAFGGVGLLLHQAALSFEIWTGQQPPLEVMSAAALAAISDRD